jgi:predicted acylesterase/phospholipase RssA
MNAGEAPKSALVLSAGGMFGAYQAGAWAFLRDRFRPDIVIGASAGALNAWAIAGGAGPEELASLWRDERTCQFFRTRFPVRPWAGLFDVRPLEMRIRELWEAYRPQTSVGVVAVELPRLRPRLFRDGEIGWRHLAASCAVPVGYPPVRIAGMLYSDGGLLGALPLWAATQVGARQVIAINALPEMPSVVVRGFVRSVRALSRHVSDVQDSGDTTVIRPNGALGRLREAMYWQKENIERWIEQGFRDAARVTGAVSAGESH